MAYPLYTHSFTEFPEGSVGRGSPIDAEFAAIAAAFAALPPFADPGPGFTTPIFVGVATDPGHALQYSQFLTWTTDVSANSHYLHNLHDPVAAQDAATKAWTQSEISAQIIAGGSPGSVQITALNRGSATALQLIRVNAGATGIEGHTLAVTDIPIGAASALDQIRVNAGATALEYFTPASSDTDLADAVAAVYSYTTF